MPLSEISNEPISGYTWTGEPPSDERNFAPTLHFPNAIGIDTRGNVFVGEVDTAKRIQKFAPVMAGGR